MRYPLPEAARQAVSGMVESLRTQTLGVVRMVTGHISSRAIGGPLMMADVARKAAELGWREVLLTMSMISIALGFMNLLPVPVLDGFHVLSAIIEGIRRQPAVCCASARWPTWSASRSCSTLMLYAFRNDAMRKWFE